MRSGSGLKIVSVAPLRPDARHSLVCQCGDPLIRLCVLVESDFRVVPRLVCTRLFTLVV